MNCQDIQKFAFTYLDGEFADHERGEFEQHLRQCVPCRAAIDRDLLLRDMVSKHLRPAPCAVRPLAGQALRARVCAGLDRVDRQQRNQNVAVSVAAVAVVMVAVAVSTGMPGDRATGGSAAAGSVAAAPVIAPPLAKVAAPPTQAAAVAPIPQPIPSAIAPQALAAANRNAMPVAAAKLGGGAAVQLVSAHVDLGNHNHGDQAGEVLGGGLPLTALVERSPFGAVRSEAGLRQMVQVHVANLTPEIAGPPARVQRYVEDRLPGAGPLPLSQGAGVQLRGARIGVLGGQPVVIYSYLAFGTALTVVSRARAQVDEADVEPSEPDHRAPNGVLLDRRGGLQLVHVVAGHHMLTLVGELSPQAMLQLLPPAPIL